MRGVLCAAAVFFPPPHRPSLQLAKSPHIIVATPGRLAALLSSGSCTVRLGHVRYLVLDEADRVLDATMAPDVDVILSALPPPGAARRTLLFSATITTSLARVRDLAMAEPVVWEATPEVRAGPGVIAELCVCACEGTLLCGSACAREGKWGLTRIAAASAVAAVVVVHGGGLRCPPPTHPRVQPPP
jgi:hypothetical protein